MYISFLCFAMALCISLPSWKANSMLECVKNIKKHPTHHFSSLGLAWWSCISCKTMLFTKIDIVLYFSALLDSHRLQFRFKFPA